MEDCSIVQVQQLQNALSLKVLYVCITMHVWLAVERSHRWQASATCFIVFLVLSTVTTGQIGSTSVGRRLKWSFWQTGYQQSALQPVELCWTGLEFNKVTGNRKSQDEGKLWQFECEEYKRCHSKHCTITQVRQTMEFIMCMAHEGRILNFWSFLKGCNLGQNKWRWLSNQQVSNH